MGFTECALKLEHPFDDDSTVPDDIKRAIFWVLTEGPQTVDGERAKLFRHYEEVLLNFENAERRIHASLDGDRERLVRDKKFLLFQQMCLDAGVEDTTVHELLFTRVKLAGVGEDSGQFEKDQKEPAMSNVQLMRSSKWTRRKIWQKCRAVWRR